MGKHLLLTSILGLSLVLSRADPLSRIVVGGDVVGLTEFPWQVSIQYMGHVCSGVIIAQEWVLTTASCVAGYVRLDILH